MQKNNCMNKPSEHQNKFDLLFIDRAKNGYQINLLEYWRRNLLSWLIIPSKEKDFFFVGSLKFFWPFLFWNSFRW